jgi:hypothetical protein
LDDNFGAFRVCERTRVEAFGRVQKRRVAKAKFFANNCRHARDLNDSFSKVTEVARGARMGELGHLATDSTWSEANGSPGSLRHGTGVVRCEETHPTRNWWERREERGWGELGHLVIDSTWSEANGSPGALRHRTGVSRCEREHATRHSSPL